MVTPLYKPSPEWRQHTTGLYTCERGGNYLTLAKAQDGWLLLRDEAVLAMSLEDGSLEPIFFPTAGHAEAALEVWGADGDDAPNPAGDVWSTSLARGILMTVRRS